MAEDDVELLPLRLLSCPICEEPFVDAILQCPEGHAFCRRCWKLWLKDSGRGSCPECRTHVAFSQLVRNRQVEHLIAELKEREKLRRTSSDELQQVGEKTTTSSCRKRTPSHASSSSHSSPSSPPSPLSPSSSPSSSPSPSASPSFPSRHGGLYILNAPSHRRDAEPARRLPTPRSTSSTNTWPADPDFPPLRHRRRGEPTAAGAASTAGVAAHGNPEPNPRAARRPPLREAKRTSTVVLAIRLVVVLFVAYRVCVLVPVVLQYFRAGLNPSFEMLCAELGKLWSSHWASASPSPSEQGNARELLHGMLSQSPHLPFGYVLRELWLHLVRFVYHALIVGVCITDVMLLIVCWVAHRSLWLFYRLVAFSAVSLYSLVYRLLVDPSGPQLLRIAAAYAQWLLAVVRDLAYRAISLALTGLGTLLSASLCVLRDGHLAECWA